MVKIANWHMVKIAKLHYRFVMERLRLEMGFESTCP